MTPGEVGGVNLSISDDNAPMAPDDDAPAVPGDGDPATSCDGDLAPPHQDGSVTSANGIPILSLVIG